MKIILSILFIAMIGDTAYAQDPDAGESIKYVKVASSNPDAVVQDGTDFFESESLGTLLQNQQVTLLDSTDGEYVKIRAVIGGKKVEGWVKKVILQDKPIENEPRITEASAVDGDSAPYAAPGTVSPGIIDPPWDQIDLTGKEMKPFYVGVIPAETNSALVPILVGIIGIGTLTYVILQDDDNPDDCTFTGSTTVSPSSCSLPNGSITVTVTPEGDYTYQWSNGTTGRDLLGVAEGAYMVTITRSGTTCNQILSATVTNADPLIVADFITQDADCGMQNGSITVSVSPPASYTYAWSNGSTTQNQSQLAPGNYMLTVTTAGTCMETYNITVGELPPSFTISFQPSPASCGLSDGSVVAIATPKNEYEYVWSDGQTGAQAENLTAGNYTVTVSIAGTNCSKEANVTIDELPADFTLAITSTPSGCGLADGSATVTADPPGSYTYAWSNGQSGAQVSGLTAGSYTVTVSITGTNCTMESNVNVEESPAGFTVTVTATPSGCGISDGTATATVDPPGAYTYAWSNGQTGATASGLVAGSYSVTVSITGTTCTQEGNVTVDELPAGFTVTVSSTPSGCGISDGTATVTSDPPGTYTYSWSNGQSGVTASGLTAGSYTVTVSIAGTTCSQEASVTVDELPPGFTVTVTPTPSGCGMSDGSATATVDPPGEYTFTWSNGQNGTQVSGLTPGVYTVTVSVTGSSCSAETTVTVDELLPTFTLTFTTTPAGCGLTNGSATVIVDPAGSYMYQWSTGPTDPQISNVAAGQYTVTVTTTGTMCSNSASVNVEQAGGGFTATFNTDNADCGLSNGSATITPEPPAEYTMVWSDQQTGPMLQNVVAGTYSVTVTDANSCSEEFSVTVSQDPAEYISVVNTTPGNCTGGGEITFTLTTPGAGPLNVQVTGPEGTTPLSLSPGTYLLSAFTSVTAGNYTLTVFDEQIGAACTETVNATVDNNTPALVATDDFYTTPGGQSVFENALDNDSGLNLQMTSISNENGGIVTFNSSGAFTFTPDPGFSGNASFTYTVTDGCGATSTAVVTIFVEMTVCEFEVDFETTSASCGLDDGSIIADVIEPGSYEFEWSTGDSGSTLNNVPSGTYTVTITDINLNCNLSFTVSLAENPAEHISNIVITQPSCGAPGEIQFTASSSSGNQLVMNVSHPNGSGNFFIDEGIVRLSDFIPVAPGDYSIEVFDEVAGSDCFEGFEATLQASPMLQIFLEAVFPPSAPTAMDGSATIVATIPGVLPYMVFVDGVPVLSAIANTFTVGGMGVGPHNIFIVDATGCMSNTLVVLIPFPDIIISFGTGIVQTPVASSGELPAIPTPSGQWRSGVTASVEYYLGTIPQELRMFYALPYSGKNNFSAPGYLEAEYLSGIKKIDWKNIRMKLQAGIGAHVFTQTSITDHSSFPPYYWTLRASGGYSIAKRINLQGSLSLRGWDKVEKPVVDFSVMVPLLGRSFRLLRPARTQP